MGALIIWLIPFETLLDQGLNPPVHQGSGFLGDFLLKREYRPFILLDMDCSHYASQSETFKK